MFFLRVHSVDTDHPLATDYGGFSSSSPPPPGSPRFTERRGMVHLFRTLSHAPLSSPGARSTTLFVVAVPNYFSPDDFIRFSGPRIDDVSELRFIRNDGMEDRYSVLIELTDQKAADGFYCTFNGKNFSPAEAEHYESLMLEAKSRKENFKLEAIEKAVTSKIEDIHSKLGKLGDKKKADRAFNQTLIKNQDIMWRKVKEIEERKTLSLKSKDEQILDLEEQIRDLKVYIGAQKTLDKMNDEDCVKGGTLLPVPLEQSTSARKSKKPSRRRK